MRLYASLWSLRGYPTASREWSWSRKLARISEQGFSGILSPPIPAVARRGSLRYLAIASLRDRREAGEMFERAAALGADALQVQLGWPDTTPDAALRLALELRARSERVRVPFAVEFHRGTFLETPERALGLLRAYRERVGERLPFCADHSHFAVVRHCRAPFWAALRRPPTLLQGVRHFHLRPFNGHHAQLPVLRGRAGRQPEYRPWMDYVGSLFRYLQAQRDWSPLYVVPELGHEHPAYRLRIFGDTWRDLCAVTADLRALWARAGGHMLGGTHACA